MDKKEIGVQILMEEGDVLGATPSENLVITRIQPGTLAEGKLQEGDKILKVNGREPQDIAHFYRLIVAAGRSGTASITVCRDQKAQEELKESLIQVPQERIGHLRLRDGFRYKLVTMEYVRGEKVGLGIKDYMNCVVVTKAPEGTMAGRSLGVGDQICDVDGTRVTDKGVAQNLIVGALKSKQQVTMVVASPASDEAKKWVDESLRTQPVETPAPEPVQLPAKAPDVSGSKPPTIICRDPPSFRVKNDVCKIARKEIERRRGSQEPTLQSIIRGPRQSTGKRVSYNSKLTSEHLIVSENAGVNLRPVK